MPKLYLKAYLSPMDDDQDTKEPSQRTQFTGQPVDQVNSGLVLAMSLQEQETAFTTMQETIESESDEENENNNNADDDDDRSNIIDDNTHFDYDFFQSMREFHEVPELEFIEDDEDSSDDDDIMDEDIGEFDVDELSYEELIALGEFIGAEKKGLSLNEVSKCLNPFVCKSSSSSISAAENRCSSSSSSNGIDRCVICQIEYEDGEALVALLPCEHPYHSECIIKWLQIKKCCPICSTEVNSSSNKLKHYI